MLDKITLKTRRRKDDGPYTTLPTSRGSIEPSTLLELFSSVKRLLSSIFISSDSKTTVSFRRDCGVDLSDEGLLFNKS